MVGDFAAAVAANRFGLGARPGEIARIGADPRGALRSQLAAGAPILSSPQLGDSAGILAQAAVLRVDRRGQRQAKESAGNDAASNSGVLPEPVQKLAAMFREHYVDEAVARLRAAVASERSFVERLVQFWSNHFAVSVDKLAVLGVAGAFEREAIRPNVLGSFRDLLLAVERHPAMLLYLDNFQSVGPNSSLAKARSRRGMAGDAEPRKFGINENLAREILELHTLGVDGGYTQGDVTEFAKVITGWSIGGGEGRMRGGEPGRFYFRDALHEPGARYLLGREYGEAGEGQGIAVLADLARAPATARHVATKLARHFIADDPPQAVVVRLSGVFTASDGNLSEVYRALIDSTEAWAQPLAKYKTPSDYITSSYRALAQPVPDGAKALSPFELLGQRTYSPGSPAGWPDRAADWDGSSELLKRLQWADQIGQRVGSRVDASTQLTQALGTIAGDHTRTAIARAESGAQALTLLLASPEFMRR